VRQGKRGTGLLVANAFGLCELGIVLGMLSLFAWFAPTGMGDGGALIDSLWRSEMQFLIAATYAAAVAFLEPYFVAAGFGLYLNRRVELEAWDLEQEFRHAQPR
jgi:hypothetical protein